MHIQYPTVIILSAIFFVFIINYVFLYNKSKQDNISDNNRNKNTKKIN